MWRKAAAKVSIFVKKNEQNFTKKPPFDTDRQKMLEVQTISVNWKKSKLFKLTNNIWRKI